MSAARGNGPGGERPLSILVATDGSRGSNAALKFAARLLSRDPTAGLTLLTVAPAENGHRESSELPPALAAAVRKFAARGVTAAVRSIRPRGSRGVPETIAREAEKIGADLVVVGSEGRDTLSEWVVGGNALRLIYLARCPVVVVRPPRRRRVG
jgi:nucleotide-binding universal stress UspA family protein